MVTSQPTAAMVTGLAATILTTALQAQDALTRLRHRPAARQDRPPTAPAHRLAAPARLPVHIPADHLQDHPTAVRHRAREARHALRLAAALIQDALHRLAEAAQTQDAARHLMALRLNPAARHQEAHIPAAHPAVLLAQDDHQVLIQAAHPAAALLEEARRATRLAVIIRQEAAAILRVEAHTLLLAADALQAEGHTDSALLVKKNEKTKRNINNPKNG